MSPLTPTASSRHVEHPAGSLDAARSTLCKVLFGLGHDELRVLMRLAMQMSVGIERHGPLELEGEALEFVRGARDEIEQVVVYFTCVLLGVGRCA
jgi:hypothetical protein